MGQSEPMGNTAVKSSKNIPESELILQSLKAIGLSDKDVSSFKDALSHNLIRDL